MSELSKSSYPRCVPAKTPAFSLQRFSGLLRGINLSFTRLARRRRLSIAIVAISAFVVSAALALMGRFPQPSVHDEFSYILAADTFAHGRLTNPTHPLWVHFESPHIIHQPSYASKYPPGQGLFLAAGQVLGGHPIVGVWLSTGFACGAICWMLMSWMPPRWALLGGLLAVIHPLILGWSQCYWGGAVAMGGGALVVGAFRRLVRIPRTRDAVLLGVGMAVLANSRPYEGFVLCLSLMVFLFLWIRDRKSPSWGVWVRRLVLPLSLVLVITASWMAYYNWRVTANAFRMPYMVHEAAYAVAPSFIWQPVRPEPSYRHKQLRDFHIGFELPFYYEQRTPGGLLFWGVAKILILLIVIFQSVGLVVPMVTLPLVAAGNRWMRVALVCCGVVVLSLLGLTFVQSHYSAPIVGVVLLMVMQSMRYSNLWRWRGVPLGRILVYASVVLCVGSSLFFLRNHLAQERGNGTDWGKQRAQILARLNSDGDRHLVVVRYSDEHSAHDEWVYNESDIDSAKVVWAHEMGTNENDLLINYFKNRRVWLLDVGTNRADLGQYVFETDR